MIEVNEHCVVLFSGGSDSTAAAILMARKYNNIHLLTFVDDSNSSSSSPLVVVEKLKEMFPSVIFKHVTINTNSVLKNLMYRDFFLKLRKGGLLMSATCGFSSTSWHIHSLEYCLENNVHYVVDGMTKEMMHLPGHMLSFGQSLQRFYSLYDVSFSSPVLEWNNNEYKTLEDKFIINHHGFLYPSEEQEELASGTGKFLFEQGFYNSPDIKGSSFDKKNQQDCYPFVLYNILIYWLFGHFYSDEELEQRVSSFFTYILESYEIKNIS